MTPPTPTDPSADLAWLDTAVATGDVAVFGNELRSKVFDLVCADRDGPVARRLLDLATDSRASVRLTVVRLLTDLCPDSDGWPAAGQVAAVALADPEEAVRRAAAWLLAEAADRDTLVAAFDAYADPVVRVAIAETLWPTVLRGAHHGSPELVRRMRHDDLPAVRFIGTLMALLTTGDEGRAALGHQARADLVAAGELLGGAGSRVSWRPGERWAAVLGRGDREEDSGALAERLLCRYEPEPVRRAGVDIAVEAMRRWRAAPSRLAPVLSAVLTGPSSGVRTAAVDALCASLTATRLVADRLVPLLAEPALSATVATALGRVGDLRAVPHLVRMLRAGDSHPGLSGALVAVAPDVDDPTDLVEAARQAFATPGHDRPGVPPPVLAAVNCLGALGERGAAAVPDLIALTGAAADRADRFRVRLGTFALERIGPPAEPALPLLRQLAVAGDSTADQAVRALLAVSRDRSIADDHLAARPARLGRCRIAPFLFDWLVDHGGLTDRQARQLDHLFARPGVTQARTAVALWRHRGPVAAPVLLAELPKYLDDDAFGPDAMRALAAMGRHARPALPDLDRLIASRHRVAVHLGDADAELRADERLLDTALTTRARVAG